MRRLTTSSLAETGHGDNPRGDNSDFGDKDASSSSTGHMSQFSGGNYGYADTIPIPDSDRASFGIGVGGSQGHQRKASVFGSMKPLLFTHQTPLSPGLPSLSLSPPSSSLLSGDEEFPSRRLVLRDATLSPSDPLVLPSGGEGDSNRDSSLSLPEQIPGALPQLIKSTLLSEHGRRLIATSAAVSGANSNALQTQWRTQKGHHTGE